MLKEIQVCNELTDAGIIDLGGQGELLLEIEYIDIFGDYIEAFYRLPATCVKHEIEAAAVANTTRSSNLALRFRQSGSFFVALPTKIRTLLEVRLPATSNPNITGLFA